jgi:hypothetical protein
VGRAVNVNDGQRSHSGRLRRVEWFAVDVVLRDLVGNLLLSIFVMGRLVGMPGSVSLDSPVWPRGIILYRQPNPSFDPMASLPGISQSFSTILAIPGRL